MTQQRWMSLKFFLPALMALLLAVAVSCGGGDDPATTAPTAPTAEPTASEPVPTATARADTGAYGRRGHARAGAGRALRAPEGCLRGHRLLPGTPVHHRARRRCSSLP